jgi:hypothetical protein
MGDLQGTGEEVTKKAGEAIEETTEALKGLTDKLKMPFGSKE